jgi:site-specific DNA-methyltransferase (adenine-specific)
MKTKMKTNTIYNENCLDTMARMKDDFVDLTVTSPPYDNLRTYNGFDFDWKAIIKELYRVTKEGGVVVWVVGDATIKGSETGTSFKQALYAIDCGFNLHDTMIWNKQMFSAVGSLKLRYAPVFEYMFIFSKGTPKTFNPIKDRVNKSFGRKITGTNVTANRNSRKVSCYGNDINKFGQRFNVWEMSSEMNRTIKHPAPFPEQLANDHIISWSNEEDLVYDPFMGSGTTAKMAIVNNRRYVGSEMSKEYCEIAEERINKTDLFSQIQNE